MNLLAIILGLISWGILIYAIGKRKRLSVEKLNKLRFTAWVLCAVSLYIPSIILSRWAKLEYIRSFLDCAFGYHFGASVLLCVTVVLTIISFILYKKEK